MGDFTDPIGLVVGFLKVAVSLGFIYLVLSNKITVWLKHLSISVDITKVTGNRINIIWGKWLVGSQLVELRIILGLD